MSKTKKKPEAAPPEKQVTLSVPESLYASVQRAVQIYNRLAGANHELRFFFKQWERGIVRIEDVFASAHKAKLAFEDADRAAFALLNRIYEEASKGTVRLEKDKEGK